MMPPCVAEGDAVTAVFVDVDVHAHYRDKPHELAASRAKRQPSRVDTEVNKLFVSTLTLPPLQAEYGSERPSSSKKLAEQLAAGVAVQAEFPELFARISSGSHRRC
jgi:hypothetical protein